MGAQESVDFLFDISDFTKATKELSKNADEAFNHLQRDAAKAGKTIDSQIIDAIKKSGKVTNVESKIAGESLKTHLGKPAAEVGGKMESAFGGAAESIKGNLLGGLKALTGPLLAIGAGLITIKGAMDAIPEIGLTFQKAGDIITRNFFAPLRRELLPILQKILDWVADNRLVFVRLGSVMVNVFRTASVAAKILWDLIYQIGSTLVRAVQKAIGAAGQTIEETVNLILFKITLILMVIKPYIEKIGVLFSSIIEGLVSFYKNYIEAYFGGRFFSLLSDIAKAFGDLFDAISKINIAGVTLGDVFGKIGLVIGSVVGVEFESLLITLKTILKVATDLISLDFKGIGKDIVGAGKDIGANFLGRAKTIGSAFTSKESKVQDAIIRPDGSVVHTDPGDTIIATKNIPALNPSGGGGKGLSIGSIVDKLMVYVTEGNAKQAGANLAEGLGDKIRQILQREMAAAGYF